jgi:hypothetical protein
MSDLVDKDGHFIVPPKIAIALPTHDRVPATFMYHLASLCAYTVAALPEHVSFGINMVAGTYIHKARQDLADEILAQGATHVLWLDTDMTFPRESLVHLLQRNVDMVGINYATRTVPSQHVAIKTVGAGPEGAKLVTDVNSEGLEKVEAVGFGMVLMKTRIFNKLPDPVQDPWFWYEWIPERKAHMGEDVYFCRVVRDAGFDIYVDHDLSKLCGHTGDFEYKVQHLDEWYGTDDRLRLAAD